MAQRDASSSGYFLKRAEPSKGLALFPTLTGRERIIHKSRTCPNLPRWTDILVGSCSKSEKHCNYIHIARTAPSSVSPRLLAGMPCALSTNISTKLISPSIKAFLTIDSVSTHSSGSSIYFLTILKSMLGSLKNEIVGGLPILSKTISLRTVESEIAKSLTSVQDKNKDVEIGSYPFFQAGKLGVSIVIRSDDQNKINLCNSQILEFVSEKKIEVVDRD